MIKKVLYILTGFSWGICAFNIAIIVYAIFITLVTIFVDITLDDLEK